jgi:hypothetical protein
MTPSNRKLLAKIKAKLAEPPRSTTGNWVIGISGNIIWDPWDFPEPTAEEAAATRAHWIQQMEQIGERLRAQPGYVPPTEADKAESRRRLDEAVERYEAEKAAVRAFTAKIERERAERAA